MKWKMYGFILWLLASFTTAAQTSVPSEVLIRGRVIDAYNQSALAGTSVEVDNRRWGAIADLNGNFTLSLPPGEHRFRFSYLGYRDTTLLLSVTETGPRELKVALGSASRLLSGVTVTGYLQGQARALNQQKNADNIRNIVSADQIGRFPDPNAAEALQRVPGVNIERDQGEGRYVLIRGLAPQFTNININGEQIPSPEADVRFVALDAIPSDQLASMEVSKTLTPDMDGDAIGGSVNLITRTAQSRNLHVNGSLVGGYNNLMKQPNVQGQLQADKRFGKNEQLGVMLNANYYHNHLGSDNWEQSPADNELELRDYELIRTRLGLSGTLDYRLNERHEFYLRGLYSRFTDREWRRRYVFIPDDEEIEKLTKDRFEAQSVSSVNLGGRHHFGKWFWNYEGQLSYGEQDTPYDHEVGFIAGLPSSFTFPSPEYPGLDAPGYTDNSAYEFDEVEYGKTLAKDRNLTAKMEWGFPFRTTSMNGLIKAGAKVRFKEKSYTITNDAYESGGGVPSANEFDEGPIKDEFLEGRYEMGRPIDVYRFNRFFVDNPGLFELDVEGKAINEALESYQAKENVYAAFLMGRFEWKKWMLLGGLRYEKTDVSYESSDVIINAEGDLEQILPISGESEYDFLLPQVQVRWALDRVTNLRGSATYSYARPNFSEIVPAQEINVEDDIATVGNAALKPVSALNLDLMIEHYFGNVGVISGGVFFKRLEDFIYRRVLFNSPYPLTGTPIISSIDVVQAQNGEDARLLGFEFAFQRKLDFLGGFLRHFNVYANYTYTNSNAKIQSRDADDTKPDATEELRLPGQATHVGNFALAFENRKLVVRLAANFNGRYLSEIGGEPAEDLYVKSRVQLDMNASYSITPRIRVFAEALNLTNQPFQTYLGSENILSQREFYSWWTRLGVKFDLSFLNR